MKLGRILVAVAPLLAAWLMTPGPALGQAPPEFMPGEVIVRFEGERERLLSLPTAVPVEDAARSLAANPNVAYAVPNYIARASFVPNDPGLAGVAGGWQWMQWNFLPCGSLCGQSPTPLPFQARGGLNAVDAWDTLRARGRAGAKGVKVAVLDTGVAFRSKRKFRKSPDFARKQFLPGFDFVKRNKFPLDRDGHGTHVAGTIGERTNNGFALTGLAHKARMIPVRVLDAQGLGTARDIAMGIRFAARRGARVINMSFEFSTAVNSCKKIKSVCKALKFATKRHRAVVAAAAGNTNGAPIAFPAAAPRVIGVGRVTKDACQANLSRTGRGLDLVAPGGGLPTLPTCGSDDSVFRRDVPIFQLTFAAGSPRNFSFPNSYEGTSMAAAHVSGVAAMVIASGVLGRKPSPGSIQCQLKRTARNGPGQLGQDYDPRVFGAGLVDAAAAVASRAPGC